MILGLLWLGFNNIQVKTKKKYGISYEGLEEPEKKVLKGNLTKFQWNFGE